jgi:Cu-Zn family superoxide dismutase
MQQTKKFSYMETERPALVAEVRGNEVHPDIVGTVNIYWLPDEYYLQADFEGLPPSRVFGFHIHDGIVCAPIDGDKPFSEAGGHYNNCGEGVWCSLHPYHAGDLPPIFSDSEGRASMQVYTDRATVGELSGKPIVLHGLPDDFRTQPSGDSGVRIACGILKENL